MKTYWNLKLEAWNMMVRAKVLAMYFCQWSNVTWWTDWEEKGVIRLVLNVTEWDWSISRAFICFALSEKNEREIGVNHSGRKQGQWWEHNLKNEEWWTFNLTIGINVWTRDIFVSLKENWVMNDGMCKWIFGLWSFHWSMNELEIFCYRWIG